jgi:hypothetical protein
MSGIRVNLGRRGAAWRRWLLPCLALFALQAAAPALAWCLHDGAGAHVEAALAHCDHEDSQHQTVDAQQPGASVTQGGGATGAPCPVIVARLLLADWFDDLAPHRPTRAHVAHMRPPPRIESLAGHTTRLLI